MQKVLEIEKILSLAFSRKNSNDFPFCCFLGKVGLVEGGIGFPRFQNGVDHVNQLKWIDRWQESYPRFVEWVEETIGETFTFLTLPKAHHCSLKSTKLLERLNEEIKRRTRVVWIFPNAESGLRLIRSLYSEVHNNWVSGKRYLDMNGKNPEKKQTMAVA